MERRTVIGFLILAEARKEQARLISKDIGVLSLDRFLIGTNL